MATDSYVSLHTHSEHSLLDGLSTIEDLVDRVVELNQDAVSVTDHGECSGHLRLQRACRKKDVKPILGMEGYFCDDVSVREGKKGEFYDHMTLIAKTTEGLHNLWALSSVAWTTGLYYGNPRFDWGQLDFRKKGVIATGGCMGGCVGKYLNPKDTQYSREKAIYRVGSFLEMFKDDFYLEIHSYNDPEIEEWNKEVVSIAKEFSIPLLAVSDSHYLRPEDSFAHELMTCIQTGKNVQSLDRIQHPYNALAMYSEDQMRKRLSYLADSVVDEAIKNTRLIAESCKAEIEEREEKPMYLSNRDEDRQLLHKLAQTGFQKKIVEMKDQYKIGLYEDQLLKELQLIDEKDFPGYFLTVADVVNWAKDEGMLVGPGRGSAGGSLLAYVLNITNIDPLEADLYFERFLDPGRDTLPDIDIDFPKEKRHLVRDYLERRHGKENIATVGTLNELAIKATLRDLCRGLNIPIGDTNQICAIIDEGWMSGKGARITWDENLGQLENPKFDIWKDRYPQLFQMVPEFVTHIRHAGAHAAGIIISRDSLIGKIPLRFKTEGGSGGDVRTQFDMTDLDEMGFLKLDALGLRTLSTLERAYHLVKERKPNTTLDWYDDWQYFKVQYEDDPKVWKLFEEGHTLGIFQIETPGLTALAKRFKPRSLEDLCSLVSVFRPGISRTIDRESGLSLLEIYMQRREGKRAVTYKHPLLEGILSKTYGNFVYQEQIMKACEVLAGYSLTEADRVRKILGKMLIEKMKPERLIFVQGCDKTNGIYPEIANSIFDDMEKFGTYGYNRAHGWGYGVIAHWCAYMKANYPEEFMAALFQTNPSWAKQYTREARRCGIPVLGPDINESQRSFTLTPSGSIRYGLSAVKWTGDSTQTIVDLQPFESMRDFVERVPKKSLNKRSIEALIRVGAFNSVSLESMEENSPTSLWETPSISPSTPQQAVMRSYWSARGDWKKIDEICACGKCPCPGAMTEFQCKEEREWHLDDVAGNERELLGTSVSVDPLGTFYEEILRRERFVGEYNMVTGESAVVGGIISRVKKLKTKTGKNPGQDMCQIFIERGAGPQVNHEEDTTSDEDVQIVVFPDAYQESKWELEVGAPVLIDCTKLKDGGLSLNEVERLDKSVR